MMKFEKLVEVKYFEPAKNIDSHPDSPLDGYLAHPSRHRYCNCWAEGEIEHNCKIRMVGAEGEFKFAKGKCSNFLGEFEAEIVKEIPRNRWEEADRFEASPCI